MKKNNKYTINPFLIDKGKFQISAINRLIIPLDELLCQNRSLISKKEIVELISITSFSNLIKVNGEKLNIDPNDIDLIELPKYLSKILNSKKLDQQKLAKDITQQFSENIGLLLIFLKNNNSVSMNWKRCWHEDGWNYLRSINKVYLAGGLCSGEIGKEMVKCINSVFKMSQRENYNVEVLPQPSLCSLVGAARNNIDHDVNNLVFDFGHSYIKRGVASYKKNEITNLSYFEAIRSEYVSDMYEDLSIIEAKKVALELFRFIANIIKETWQNFTQLGSSLGRSIIISIANDLIDNKFDKGGYGKLRFIGKDIRAMLNEELKKHIGSNINITFINDGECAADSINNHFDYLVLTLGTGIGGGFPDKTKELINISKSFNLSKIKQSK